MEAPNGENNKELNTIEYDNIESGMWIIIEYDEAMFLGKVERKITSCEIHEKCARVRCFKKPYGKRGTQDLENEYSVICYERFYNSPIIPQCIRVGRAWKYSY